MLNSRGVSPRASAFKGQNMFTIDSQLHIYTASPFGLIVKSHHITAVSICR